MSCLLTGSRLTLRKLKLLKHSQSHLMSKSFKASSDLLAITGNSSLGFPSLLNLCTSCVGRLSLSWQQKQQAAFEELKGRLISAPVLAYPNFSAEAGSFILDTDASQYQGIGAVLSQQQQDGTERVIAYGSRSLNEHEKNYCTTRLEMLALVTYVNYFRYYLLGRRFCVRTDHSSLRWLRSFNEPQGQVARWLERLGFVGQV